MNFEVGRSDRCRGIRPDPPAGAQHQRYRNILWLPRPDADRQTDGDLSKEKNSADLSAQLLELSRYLQDAEALFSTQRDALSAR